MKVDAMFPNVTQQSISTARSDISSEALWMSTESVYIWTSDVLKKVVDVSMPISVDDM